jgi:4-hydroxy-3-methylbut-2-enyl diphosphate reductase
VFVDDLDRVPRGRVVVFSAHGVSPAVRAQARIRNLHAIDATCPLVTKVHSEAVRFAARGHQILLVGHRDHHEVIGTTGEAPDAIQVVESPADIPSLDIKDPDKLIYLTQTTLSTDDAATVINALRRAFPNIKAPPTSDICYATTNRQHAVRQLAPQCDLVLVVGSRNSSNSVRLTEIARNAGTPAHLLDDATGLKDEWFRPSERATGGLPASDLDKVAPLHPSPAVLITAGASAPEDLVADLCKSLLTRFGGTIEQADIFDEDVEFALPAQLKRDIRARGQDPDSRRIRITKPAVTPDLYGATLLTISAKP